LTFIIGETNDLGGYTVLKQADSLSELSRMDIESGIFPAVFVSRADIDRALFPDEYEEGEPEEINTGVAKLTDGEMIQIAADLQDVYVEYGSYWDDLESICEDLHEGEDT
jgi:hypothetical protein